MKLVDTSKLSADECWGVQINGFKHCTNCKWIGISACEGKNIVDCGRNSYGYLVTQNGINYDDYDVDFDQRIKQAFTVGRNQ